MIHPARSCSLKRVFLTVAVLFAVCYGAMAQEAARPNRGAALNRNYAISDIENINLQNGNVQLSIPLAALPPIAGGKLSLTVSANYNSKLWDVLRYQEEGGALEWSPYVVDQPGHGGGWVIGGAGYAIVFRNADEDFDRVTYQQNSGLPQWELDLLNNHSWWKVILIKPDGSEHELRPLDNGSYWGSQDFLRGYYNVLPSGTPKRYYTNDGSYLFARISNISDWTVYLPDGTRVMQTPDGVQRIQDTNGNKIKLFTDANGAHYQDEQTGREIRVTYDPAANGGQGQYRVWYPTVGGTQHFIEINMGLTTVQGKTYKVMEWDAIAEAPCEKTTIMSPAQLVVVRTIIFPQTEPGQQRKFTFKYNSDDTVSASTNVNWTCNGPIENYTRTASVGWGELSRVVSPPGEEPDSAYADYSYWLGHSLEVSNDNVAKNSIVEKKLTHDGIEDIWTYNVSETTSSLTGPDGSTFNEWRYCSTFGQPNCATDKAGLAYRSRRPFVLTEKHWINLVFSGADIVKPGGVVSCNPVMDFEYTTLLDASNNPLKMSAKAFQYDYNGNVTKTTEYDWFDPGLVSRDAQGVPTGVPGGATVLRVTDNSYYNQAVGSTSSNVYAKRSIPSEQPLIINAAKETIVGPSIVQLSYDGQAYGTAPTVGNLTTKKIWVNLDAKWITTSNSYGPYGNIATSTDALGKVTEFFFDDATHALPNRVVVDPQNGTGTQTTTTVFDYHTGLVLSQTDVNGQQSTIDYTNHRLGTIDPFGRPGLTKSPSINIEGTNHQRRVKTTYFDSVRQVVVEADLNAENDKLLKTKTTTDMLGRPTKTETTEDGTNYTISVENRYLNLSKVTLTSSPRRSGPEATTDSWTRVTKDIADRVIEVATFGGAAQPAWSGSAGAFTGAVTTEYDANFTKVTDQTGRVRRSLTDALGRLTRVDEPDGSGNLGPTTAPLQPTSYAYSVLDNLTTVTQGSQTRTFTYDSLSRLRTAVNPESGTITYQYDDNGNLLVKTDARGVSAHYAYDSINRVTRRWYNGSNATTATTHNSPALPSGVGATDEVKFYYDTQALPVDAPSYSRGSAVGRLVAQTYGTGSNGDYYAYDVLGRATLKFQQTGTINYQLGASYTLAGAVSSQSYPSGHTITNSYDQAGRLTGFSGNLGDGVTRTYASGILYSPLGGLVKEEFGTATAIYNKLFYNSRGQLAEIRTSTSYSGPGDTSWNRGAIINHYSDQCWGACSPTASMPDNNGNLKKQEVYIPNNDQIPTTSYSMRWQQYEYDSLNRLQWVREVLDGGAEQWKQQFTYDRWGNRTINTGVTYGTGINNKAFTVNIANNRLGVPGGQSGVMSYDAAGNLTNDTYTGAGNRTYDGENKITSAWGGNNQAQLYKYDGSGQRIKRTVDGVETWQVYGFGGELLAEYGANGAASSPQKEYGYRNGQLLVTAEAGTRTNVALAASGGTVTASSTLTPYLAQYVIDGSRRATNNDLWLDNTSNSFPDWIEVSFNGSKTISEIDVITQQDAYPNTVEPSLTQTFSLYGITAFEVQYWNGTTWATVPGGSVTANNKVWRQFSFAPITTSKIRVVVNGGADNAFSRVVEVEAWAEGQPQGPANYALTASGGTATASSTLTPYLAQHVIDGSRRATNNDLWLDNTYNSFPDWIEVSFNGNKTISEIDVITQQDAYPNTVEPSLTQTFSLYGITAFEVQYWNGTTWATVPGGSVTANNKVWRQFSFAPITTSKIRVVVNGGADNAFSRVVEVEAWGNEQIPSSSNLRWVVSDHLGTPRMIFDQAGSLANVKRHDYLPFGEELFAPTGGRSTAQGYSGGDGVRQQFTLKERDVETGLDYFINRYYSSTQGRFTSVDPTLQSIDPANPQTLNRYTYALNNPLAFIDPDGLDPLFIGSYDKLTDEQKRLFETYVQKNYAEELKNPLFSAESLWNNSAAVANSDAAAGPNSRLLDDGQLTNFIGVTKMLEKRGVIDQVASISEIHGDKPEGKTYRVYGELKNNTTAVEAIKKAFTHKIPGKGHGEYSESRREQGLFGAPNGQVNRVPTGTGVDIDVDYRCILCPGHVSKGGVGSDIRVGTHYEDSRKRYGPMPALSRTKAEARIKSLY